MPRLLWFLLLAPTLSFAQYAEEDWADKLQFEVHSLVSAGDTLVFLSSRPSGKAIPDTTLIFIQGSLPKPLLVITPQGPAGIFPFNHYPFTDRYRFIILGKPGVPLQATSEELQKDYSYAPNGQFPLRYTSTYSLRSYERRYRILMDSLFGEKPSEQYVVLAGHSEGARIAARAGHHPAVDRVVYLSANPFGRQAGIMAEERLGKRRSREWHPHDGENWSELPDARSFDAPLIQPLLTLNKPLLVGYGTADYGAVDCEKLPIFFGDVGRSHQLTLKAWANRDHNFFGVKEDGEVDYADFYWDTVWGEIVEWMRK